MKKALIQSEGSYCQLFHDPVMAVGIRAIKDEANIKEADLIVESLSVMNMYPAP